MSSAGATAYCHSPATFQTKKIAGDSPQTHFEFHNKTKYINCPFFVDLQHNICPKVR